MREGDGATVCFDCRFVRSISAGSSLVSYGTRFGQLLFKAQNVYPRGGLGNLGCGSKFHPIVCQALPSSEKRTLPSRCPRLDLGISNHCKVAWTGRSGFPV